MSSDRGTFSERLSRLGERRRAGYAPLFDGRPEVAIANTQLLPDQAARPATAYGYRYARTRGHKSVRERVFVPDPDPAARYEALPPARPGRRPGHTRRSTGSAPAPPATTPR